MRQETLTWYSAGRCYTVTADRPAIRFLFNALMCDKDTVERASNLMVWDGVECILEGQPK